MFWFIQYIDYPVLISSIVSIVGIIVFLIIQGNIKSKKEDEKEKAIDLMWQKFLWNFLITLAGLIGPFVFWMVKNRDKDFLPALVVGGIAGLVSLIVGGVTIGTASDMYYNKNAAIGNGDVPTAEGQMNAYNIIMFCILLLANSWVIYDSTAAKMELGPLNKIAEVASEATKAVDTVKAEVPTEVAPKVDTTEVLPAATPEKPPPGTQFGKKLLNFGKRKLK